jgi:hypothetical protein
MSEQYKSANYINTGTLMKVQTNGDLKLFIELNMHLSEDEMYDALKGLIPLGTEINYIKNTIKKIKRKRKIELLLNESFDNK